MMPSDHRRLAWHALRKAAEWRRRAEYLEGRAAARQADAEKHLEAYRRATGELCPLPPEMRAAAAPEADHG